MDMGPQSHLNLALGEILVRQDQAEGSWAPQKTHTATSAVTG